ncbi:MAG: GTP cyclohydrolase I FolE [Gemmatimonadota bacterium]|nr:MAG: GTP cyclohydrolase I FolE [Gemmatimonadota bacterium]
MRPSPNGNGDGKGRPTDVDQVRIARAVREILAAIGEDPDRERLFDTPARVARAYVEMFAGMREDAVVHLAKQFDQEQEGDDAIVLKNIQFTSMCEHHLLPFAGRAHVAYLPDHGKVTGLSKLARTVDVFARRPQLQERLTAQIADALVEHLDPRGVAVVVEAEHSCLKLRGAEKHDAEMVTSAFRRAFERDRVLRGEVLQLMRVGGR